jgi:hypothetical protein
MRTSGKLVRTPGAGCGSIRKSAGVMSSIARDEDSAIVVPDWRIFAPT